MDAKYAKLNWGANRMKNKELHSEFTFQIEPKHYFKHNYLTYCNDVLVSMLKYADEEKMASVSIDLSCIALKVFFCILDIPVPERVRLFHTRNSNMM